VCKKRGSKSDGMTDVSRLPHAPYRSETFVATSRPGLHASSRSRQALRAWGLGLLLMLLALEGAGCSNWFKPVAWPELGAKSNKQPEALFRVVPKKSMGSANLKPEDIVRIMQRVGFADEQILDLGTDLHNALLFSGAAEIFYQKTKLAIFVADANLVRIRSRASSFDYDVSTGQLVSAGPREQ